MIGANLSGGNWFKASLVGMRLGVVAFLVPFFFVLDPALIARGPAFDVVMAAISGVFGAILLAAGFFGYLLGPLNWLLRALYLIAGGLLLAPDNRLFLAGGALALAGMTAETLLSKRRRQDIAGRSLP